MRIKDFIRHFEKQTLDTNLILEEASRRALRNIKARHGSYPTDIEWAKLKPDTVANKVNGDTPLLETGELRNSYKITSLGENAREIGSNLDKALWMEEGVVSQNIPARPVCRPEKIQADIYMVAIADRVLNTIANNL